MRKTIQLVLFLFAVFALVVTGVAFYQIVLASTIHGTPVRFISAQAGPYRIRLALYNNPINAGDAIPFAISVASGTRESLTYQVTASPVFPPRWHRAMSTCSNTRRMACRGALRW